MQANVQNLTLELAVQEVQALLQILGELPSKTGVFPLILKIESQAKSQLQPEQEQEAE